MRDTGRLEWFWKWLSNGYPLDGVFKPFSNFLLVIIHDQITNNKILILNKVAIVKRLPNPYQFSSLKRLKQQLQKTGRNLNVRREGWVSYRWIALIDGKVRWNIEEYTTIFLQSDWLHFVWHDINDVIKNWIIGKCNSRLFIGSAIMVYEPIYHYLQIR